MGIMKKPLHSGPKVANHLFILFTLVAVSSAVFSVSWAAEGSNAEEQYALGMMYVQGDGVAQKGGCSYQTGDADYLSEIAPEADYDELNEHNLYPRDNATIMSASCVNGKTAYVVEVKREEWQLFQFKVTNGQVLYDTIEKGGGENWKTECLYSAFIAPEYRKHYCDCIRQSVTLKGVYNGEQELWAVGRCVGSL